MAATSGNLRETVEFTPNVPVEVALKYPAGKIISTRNGERVMYSLVDGRVMFLDLGPAQKINELGVNVQEKFVVCKKWSGKRGDPSEWAVWLSPETEKARAIAEARRDGSDLELVSKLQDSIKLARKVGEQSDGTFAVPKLAPMPAVRAPEPPPPPVTSPAWSQALLAQTNVLVDAYAAALAYADKHGSRVKPEDVRALMTTCYINFAKGLPHADR